MLIFNVKLCNVLYVVIKPCQGVGEGLLQFVEVVCFVLILIVESFALPLVGCCTLKAFEVWVIQDSVVILPAMVNSSVLKYPILLSVMFSFPFSSLLKNRSVSAFLVELKTSLTSSFSVSLQVVCSLM